MKIAVIGLGYWGPNLVRNFLALKQEVFLFDKIANRSIKIAKSFPGSVPVESWKCILNDPSIEAIALAVPLPSHFTLAIDVLDAGKHLFIEKPLCKSISEADEIKRHLKGQVLMVGHITHYSSGIRMLKHQLDSGAIGEVRCFSFIRTHLGPIYSGTDVLTEVAAHDIAILFQLDSELPKSLHVWGTHRLDYGNPDAAHIVLKWPSNLTARIDVQWTSVLRRRIVISEGTRGTLIFQANTGTEHLEVHNQEGAFAALKQGISPKQLSGINNVQDIHLPPSEPLREELSTFLKCIREGSQPETDIGFSRKVIGVLEAARESMMQGGKEIIIEK
ncbi:Gfo/Idh/MocA family oxidoreductase [Candidatus Pacearchaeota archaeon]|nr:Gfo/Idh/MocA family oxidoreductase [Candidatus Pacearchaeota archaeon]